MTINVMCVIIVLVMKVKKFIKIIICMSLIFILCSCGSDEVKMNYTTEEVNEKTIYNIENKKYVESEEATNYVKIDVNN